MPLQTTQIEAAIALLEGQRAVLGDAVVETALAPLRLHLARARAAPTALLRQVTILFLDTVGSTALSQRLDPEDVHEIMDGALARCTAVVQAHGGKVLQYAGDSLLAVFGAVQTREDDAERAVRAGLAMLEEGQRHRDAVRRSHGVTEFELRIGLHTGGVLLGAGVEAESGIRGAAVNLAARMEQTAPAGGLRISHDTYRQVRGVFDVVPQPPLVVKGLDEPVQSYLVQGVRPRAFRGGPRGLEGIETRTIGRELELEQLQQAFAQLCRPGAGLARVLVTGEAGVGKSRLLDDFESWAESRAERFCRLQGRAYPQTPDQPYALLRDLLSWRLQIAESDTPEQARHKFEKGVTALPGGDGEDPAQAQAGAYLLGHLVGLLDVAHSPPLQAQARDGRVLRSRAFEAAAQWLRRLSAQHVAPVLMLLEDLHWCDQGSLDFLEYLAQAHGDLPLLMLALARPDFTEARAGWMPANGVQHLALAPLDVERSRQLADELLQRLTEVPAMLRELVTGRAEGNPFYMEELVKMLVDQGAIDTTEPRWTLRAEQLLESRVPPTLVGVLQARLDGLAPAERLALQRAAVIGPVFWDRALAAVDGEAPAALAVLLRRELVARHRDSRYEGAAEFSFRHQVLQQVAYDTLLKQDRRHAHARVADWLADAGSSRAGDHLGLAATHFDKAGLARRAAEFYAEAANQAQQRFAQAEGIAQASRGLVLVDEAGFADEAGQRLRLHLLMARERMLHLRGRRAEQQADLDALDRLAEQLDDDHTRAAIAVRRCNLALRVGDWAALERHALASMAAAERAGDRVARLQATYWLMPLADQRADFAGMLRIAESGMHEARELGEARMQGEFLEGLAIAHLMRNDVHAHIDALRQALLISGGLGLRKSVGILTNNLGCALLFCGDHATAREHLQTALRVAREVGDRQTEPYPLIALSMLALREGDPVAAQAHARLALETARSVKDPVNEAQSLVRLGWAARAAGDTQAAARAFEQAQAVALSVDHVFRFDAAAGLAEAALQSGDATAAVHAVRPLVERLGAGGDFNRCYEPPKVFLAMCRVLARTDPPLAEAALQAGLAWAGQHAQALRDPGLRQSFLATLPAELRVPANSVAGVG